jgi:hypothetical protein
MGSKYGSTPPRAKFHSELSVTPETAFFFNATLANVERDEPERSLLAMWATMTLELSRNAVVIIRYTRYKARHTDFWMRYWWLNRCKLQFRLLQGACRRDYGIGWGRTVVLQESCCLARLF